MSDLIQGAIDPLVDDICAVAERLSMRDLAYVLTRIVDAYVGDAPSKDVFVRVLGALEYTTEVAKGMQAAEQDRRQAAQGRVVIAPKKLKRVPA